MSNVLDGMPDEKDSTQNESTTPPKPSPLAGMPDESDSTIQDNFTASQSVSPEDASKTVRLSNILGATKSAVAPFLATAQKAAEVLQNKPLMDNINATHPVLAAFLRPLENMAQARKDIPNLATQEEIAQSSRYATNFFQAAKAGFQTTNEGMISFGGLPNLKLAEDAPMLYQAAFEGGKLGGSLATQIPLGMIGMALGGPPGAAIMGGGVDAALHQSLIDGYTKGLAPKDLADLVNRSIATTWEGAKGTATFGAMEAASTVAGAKALPILLKTGMSAGKVEAAKAAVGVLAGGTAMTGTAAALDRRPWTLSDTLHNIALAGGLEIAGAAAHGISAKEFFPLKESLERAQASKVANDIHMWDEIAGDNVLRKNNPELLAKLQNQQHPEPALVPVQDFDKIYPDNGATAQRLGLGDSYEMAKKTNGDVSIPMGTLLSEAMDEKRAELANSTRFDPDSMTLNQVNARDEQRKGMVKAEQDKAAAAKEQAGQKTFMDKIKSLVGIEPEPAPAAPEPPAVPPPAVDREPLPDNPEQAQIVGESRMSIDGAKSEMGQLQFPMQFADQELQDRYFKKDLAAQKAAEDALTRWQQFKTEAGYKEKLAAKTEELRANEQAEIEKLPVFRAAKDLSERVGGDEELRGAIEDHLAGRTDAADDAVLDNVAKKYGFRDGPELAASLKNIWDNDLYGHRIRTAVQQGLEDSGLIQTPEQLRVKSLDELHSNNRAEVLALKHEILEGHYKSLSQDKEWREGIDDRARQAVRDANANAKTWLLKRTVAESGNFRTFYTQEIAAARDAREAALKGDVEGAAKATKDEIQAHALSQESLRLSKQISKWTDGLKDAQQAKKASFADKTGEGQDHFSQAANLLHRYGFPRADFDPRQKTESFADWSEKNGETVTHAPWLEVESHAEDYKQLTIQQLHDLSDAVKNIQNFARRSNEAFVIRKGEGQDVQAESLHSTRMDNMKGGKLEGSGTYNDWREGLSKFQDKWRDDLIAPSTIFKILDGGHFGDWYNTFITSKSAAEDIQSERTFEAKAKWRDMHESRYTPAELKDMDTRGIPIPELGDTLTKNNILTLAANQGTEGNAEKVRSNLGVKRTVNAKGNIETTRVEVPQATVDAILGRHMEARDWELTKDKWKWLASYKTDIGTLYRKLNGFEPDWVEGRTFKTKFGEVQGDYYPLISDKNGVNAGYSEIKSGEQLGSKNTWKAGTNNDYVKTRNELARYPVSLDARGLERHVSDVIHDLSMREWVIDAQKLLNSHSVSSDISDSFGKGQLASLNNWLMQIAGNEPKGYRLATDTALDGFKHRTAVSMLGSKLSVLLSQSHGISLAANVEPSKFGYSDVVRGIGRATSDMLSNPDANNQMIKFITDNSPFMREVFEHHDKDIGQTTKDIFGQGPGGAVRLSNTFFGIAAKMTTAPVWMEAYRMELNRTDFDHDVATEFANRIIRESSVASRKSDMSPIMRSEGMHEFFTMFNGFADRQMQQMYGAAKSGSMGDMAATALAAWVLPAVSYSLFHYGLPNDKKTGKQYLKKTLEGPFGMIPIVKNFADFAMDSALGIKGNDSLSPMEGSIENIKHLVTVIKQGKIEPILEQGVKVASLANPLPLGAVGLPWGQPFPAQLGSYLFNTADYIQGKMNPEAKDLFGRRPLRQRHK